MSFRSRSRRTRRYWNDAAIVRRKKGQALRARLLLSTEPGAANQPAGGGAGGSFITSGIIRRDVALVTGDVISSVLTSSAYDPGPQTILGPIVIRWVDLKLGAGPWQYASHLGSDILLTSR